MACIIITKMLRYCQGDFQDESILGMGMLEMKVWKVRGGHLRDLEPRNIRHRIGAVAPGKLS